VRRWLPLLFLALAAFTPWQPVTEIPCCKSIAYSTWNPTLNSSAITYSSGNLVWTCGSGCSSNYYAVQGTNNHFTGKFYLEITATTISGNCCYAIGFSPAGAAPSGGTSNLGYGFGIGYYKTGAVAFNGLTATTIASYTDGNVVCIAADLSNGLIWFRVNNGNWNNSGAANPATGTGGINIATLATLNLFPAQSSYAQSGVAGTLDVGASGFTYSAPSGFGAWH